MNYLLAILSGVLFVLVFPRAGITPLASIALAPLLFAIAREGRPKQRFIAGWLAGVVYWFGVCYWIRDVLAQYGGLDAWLAWLAFLLFCILKAIHLGAFSALAGPLMRRSYAIPAAAALWVAIERTNAPLGFAWLDLGNAGINMGAPMRLAPITGVYGLSFIFLMMNAAVALVLLRRPRRQLLWLAALPLLYLLPSLPDPVRPAESAVAIQPNLSEDQDWTRESAAAMHERLAYLSLNSALDAAQQPARLILWPEVPAPIDYDADARFRAEAANLARLTRASFLFGTVAYTAKGQPLNSAQMVRPDGEPDGRYDKIHLVPFGEFVPPVFGFVNRITREAGDFVPGTKTVLFPIDGHRIGAFICYESVFPDFVRQFTAQGAELLVNLSNDGYFGKSAAHEQHLEIVRMRAAENRRWILRSTNNGITAAIDPAGRLRQELPPYTELAARLGYSYQKSLTPYTRFGDWFVWLCVAAAAIALFAAQVPCRER